MSLYDLILCECGHPRHAHPHQFAKTVLGGLESFYGKCSRDGCTCKGFLEGKPDTEEKD
jgi:hypothetical protein